MSEETPAKKYPRRYTEYDKSYSREYQRKVRAERTPEERERLNTEARERNRLRREKDAKFLAAIKIIAPTYYEKVMKASRAERARYMREYAARPEAKARRKELADAQPVEVKARIKAQSAKRRKISTLAKQTGASTQQVRDILYALNVELPG